MVERENMVSEIRSFGMEIGAWKSDESVNTVLQGGWMEEIKEKSRKIPKIGEVINYKDFFGEYPIIFGIKIISSLALVYVILEFYNYHNPLDSLITK